MKEGLMDAMAAALSLPLRIARGAVGRWADRWNRELQARDVEIERRIAQLDEATIARRLAMLAHPAGQDRGASQAKSA